MNNDLILIAVMFCIAYVAMPLLKTYLEFKLHTRYTEKEKEQ